MSTAARISVIYLIVGSLWIGISDGILTLVSEQDPATETHAQPFKNWLYIALTSAVLYVVLKDEFDARQRTENKALERETSFYELFANNPLPMWVYDRATLICLDANVAACLHYGYSHDEFVKMRIADMRPAQERLRFMNYVEEQGAGFQDVGEWIHTTKTGQIIEVESSARPLDFSGTEAVLVVIQDVTERRRNEVERLENEKERMTLAKQTELNLMRNRFTSMISHEFRRPLTTITSSIDLLEHYRDRMNDTVAKEHFENIHQQLGEAQELLDDFLALMRLEAVDQAFRPTSVSLTGLCRKLTIDAQLSAKAEHAIRYISSSASVVIDGDEKLLRHAIGNLLSNAVKYSPAGSEVRLELIHSQNIEIHVSDQGIGIPAHEQAHIFDPFYRASNVGAAEGTGLGLAIAKKAITAHGGTLEIAKSNSTGTEFIIKLPVNEPVFSNGMLTTL